MRILFCIGRVPDAETPVRIGEDGLSFLAEKSACRRVRDLSPEEAR